MTNFRLIAIRPKTGCKPEFLKILKENTFYPFYDLYDFSKYKEDDKRISKASDPAHKLYSFRNKTGKSINLNVSAIVGENGSGKSSLVELFYVFCYNLSVIKEVLYDEEEERYLTVKDIEPGINVEVYFEVDELLTCIRLQEAHLTKLVLRDGVLLKSSEDVDLNDFFYTIAINYSLHSLNSKVLGDWVKKIFHKNDGYQTPVVLNPYRNEGIIDINKEEYLVKSRLISNILGKSKGKIKTEETLRNVIDKKVAYRLKVELNEEKFIFDEKGKPVFKNTQEIGDMVLPLAYKHFLGNVGFVPEETTLNRYAKEYILYKLKSIASKYDPYKRLFRFFHEDKQKTDDFLQMLSNDKSHVTFKLNQAINFLTNEIYYKKRKRFDLTIAYLSTKLDEISKRKGEKLIDILPPAFFKVDIEFQDSQTFDLLSSGEKQRVYSIATLIYHLENLSSTHGKYINLKYRRVNIIFDELELYFHPELQRKLVNDIIQGIKRIELEEIDSLNILFITHSPFILSDIPHTNILYLDENGEPYKGERVKSFGGNIHELLGQSFFLNQGLIGEFAKDKIQEIIDILNDKIDFTEEVNNQKDLLERIKIIGEPFLRKKLLEMYYESFEREMRIAELKEELAKLESND